MTTTRALIIALLLTIPAVSAARTASRQEELKTLHRSALEQINRRNYSEAIPLLERILAISPKDKTATRYLMLAHQQSVEPYCRQAATAFLQGNYRKAIETWEKILKINPKDSRAGKLIGMTRAVMKSIDREALYVRAEQYRKEKKFEQAIVELEKILSLQPDDERALRMLKSAKKAAVEEQMRVHFEQAEAYMKQGKHDLAIEEWDKVLAIDATQESARRLIAVARRAALDAKYAKAKEDFEAGRYLASRKEYAEILSMNPTDLDVEKTVERLGKVVLVASAVEQSGTSWDMVRKAVTNHVLINGNVEAAILAIRHAEQLTPDVPLITAFREFLEREHSSVVQSMEPLSSSTSVIDQYLAAALKRIYEGRFDLAIQDCDIVLILQPDNVLALKRLGSAYYAIGSREKAQATWRKALKLDPRDNELKQFMRQPG